MANGKARTTRRRVTAARPLLVAISTFCVFRICLFFRPLDQRNEIRRRPFQRGCRSCEPCLSSPSDRALRFHLERLPALTTWCTSVSNSDFCSSHRVRHTRLMQWTPCRSAVISSPASVPAVKHWQGPLRFTRWIGSLGFLSRHEGVTVPCRVRPRVPCYRDRDKVNACNVSGLRLLRRAHAGGYAVREQCGSGCGSHTEIQTVLCGARRISAV